ncbi:M56 family metallopeptidase [Aquisphaera insulae]|uniref:M56 family metallopeptidase n=1 Tax=Aquisphaera insulae TaxID=2712864 RepID=UPI0013EDDA8B|nr:M56 family metallopeptidase [Aquisphaera insulae]
MEEQGERPASSSVKGLSTRPTNARLLERWLPPLVAAWGLGVLLLSIRLLGGWLAIRGLVRRGVRPLDGDLEEPLTRLCHRLGLRGPVRLLESARVQVPMVVGWLRPVVLLPATALTGLSSDQLALILGHELAHIRRRDFLVNLVQSLIETLFFYHPAIWWLSSRIRAERENCCDDAAVACCGDRLDYARALAALEELRQGIWSLAPSARGGTLLGRIRRILGIRPTEEAMSRTTAGTLALTSLLAATAFLLLFPGHTAAMAETRQSRAITGTVIDAAGKPVPGAGVWIVAETFPGPKAVVLGEARTDADGRYRLSWDEEIPEDRIVGSRGVWAFHDERGLGQVSLRTGPARSGVDPGRPVSLVLSPAAVTTLQVTAPDGRPAAEARVAPISLLGTSIRLPEILAARLTTRADREGSVKVVSPAGPSIEAIRVEVPGLGIQEFHRSKGFLDGVELKLVPPIAVSGRLTATDAASTQAVKLRIASMTHPVDDAWVASVAEVTTDSRGEFPAIPMVSSSLTAWPSLPVDAIDRPIDLSVKEIHAAEGRLRIVVPLVRWVKVRATVREKGTGRPVQGVGLRLHSRLGNAPLRPSLATTDETGRFEALSPPGKQVLGFVDVPTGYIKLSQGIAMPEIVGDGQELPPIELERGVELRGLVVDEAGQPVEGAGVVGEWDRIGPGVEQPNGATMFLGSTFSATATTTLRGEFTLRGIHRGANVTLEAERDEARTEAPRTAAAGLAEPVKLVISDANTVSLSGRVIDSMGRPMPGALIRIYSRAMKRDALPDMDPIRFEGQPPIRTDTSGRYATPRGVKRGFEYSARAEVESEAVMADGSPWIALGPTTAPVLGDIVVRRLRNLEGKVVDPTGRPIPGAKVRQSGDGPKFEEVETDEAGRYRLTGLFAEPVLVFASGKGYRFAGRTIEADAPTADIILEPVNGPPPAALTSLPPAIGIEQEKKLIHVLFDAYADRILKDPKTRDFERVFRILAQVDLPRAREFLNHELASVDPSQADGPRCEVAERLFGEKPDEAIEIIAAIQDPGVRSYEYERLSRLVPETDAPRRLALLEEALVAGRADSEPNYRVLRMADLGRRFLDLGRAELATGVLQEAKEMAHRLPRNLNTSWPRRRLAEELSLVDLPAAMALMKETEDDRDYGASMGHIAHRLAAKNPAEAERIVRTMPDKWPNFRDTYIQRVCYRMVAVDPDRAINLARTVMTRPNDKARAFGVMAVGLVRAKKDRQVALQLLEEAYDVLETASRGDQDQWDGLGMACTSAAGLLPLVEEVDPTKVREYLWRTLAMRPPFQGKDPREGITLLASSRVAAMVARYDRDLARMLLDRMIRAELSKLTGAAIGNSEFGAESLMTAAAYIAPYQTASRIGEFPDSPGRWSRSIRGRIREEFITVLATPPGPERWRRLERKFLHVWPIDEEEDH